jgi:tRNA(fMet)-specific endonuclease VapC
MRYLLDTNVLSQLMRDPHGDVAQRVGEHTEADVFTSIIVACELRYGARKKNSAALTQRVEQLLASLEVAALAPGVDEVYASIRTDLESRGLPIGANDVLIAAHALAESATLVTDNPEEFCRVPGLVVENWQRPA